MLRNVYERKYKLMLCQDLFEKFIIEREEKADMKKAISSADTKSGTLNLEIKIN